jgi:hypothetical protein
MQGMQLQHTDKLHPHEQHNASSPAEVATSAASHSLPAPLLTRMFVHSIVDYDACATDDDNNAGDGDKRK